MKPKLIHRRWLAARRAPGRQGGLGMIEVLVAMFVLSVGLLGVAALQSQGLRAGQTAGLRTMAVIKATEMIERMRSNPDAVSDAAQVSFYQVPAGNAGANGGCDDHPAATAAVACTPVELAAHDILRWKESLRDSMPNGDGTVVVNTATVPPTVTVTINWTERGQQLTYTTQTQI